MRSPRSEAPRQFLLSLAIVLAGFGVGTVGLGFLAPNPLAADGPCPDDMCEIDCTWDPDEGTSCSSTECGQVGMSESYCDFDANGECTTGDCDINPD